MLAILYNKINFTIYHDPLYIIPHFDVDSVLDLRIFVLISLPGLASKFNMTKYIVTCRCSKHQLDHMCRIIQKSKNRQASALDQPFFQASSQLQVPHIFILSKRKILVGPVGNRTRDLLHPKEESYH
jgi:hypothetical protein